jgi:hypothetical protein
MFGPAVRSEDFAPTANLCANAAAARLAGDPALRARWAAAGCAMALGAQTQRLTAAPAAPLAAVPPPRRAEPKAAGTLTAEDLRDPWFGPTRIPRKADGRG